MRCFVRVVHVAALCAALAFSGPAAAEGSLQGVYLNATPNADVIAQAIEVVVAKMSFIKRPIARGRLGKTNPLYRRIEISQTATDIRVRFDERTPVAMPLDGRIVKWTREDGEVFDVSARLQGSELTQAFQAEDGLRVNRFSLSPDGNGLTLQVTLSSPRLPEAVKYTLTYRRSP